MYERGQFKNGAYRGMLPLVGVIGVHQSLGGFHFDFTGLKLLAATIACQPFNIMMTQRQAINTVNLGEPNYRQILASNPLKLVTLGFTAALSRNALLMTAFLPKTLGNEWMPMDIGFTFGAILLSHPFEVARVLVTC